MPVTRVIKPLNMKYEMNKEALKYGTKDIQYVSGNNPVFQMPSYDIKSGRSHVSTGEYMNFFANRFYLRFHHISITQFRYHTIST